MDFGRVHSVKGLVLDLPPDPMIQVSSEIGHPPQIFSGCPMWSHKDWEGKVYPKTAKSNEYLRYYARAFSAIELNSSYYHLPSVETIKRWVSMVPSGFRFCPKIPKIISHDRELVDIEDWTKSTCESFQLFDEHFGAAFLQMSPKFDFSKIERLQKFLAVWDENLPLAVELRHPSWLERGALRKEVEQLFKESHTSAVLLDTPGRRDVLHVSLTSSFLFVRFLGHGLHSTDVKRLEQWAHRLRYWLENRVSQVFFFTHQPDDCLAPETVVEFHKIINRICDLELKVPDLKAHEGQTSLL